MNTTFVQSSLATTATLRNTAREFFIAASTFLCVLVLVAVVAPAAHADNEGLSVRLQSIHVNLVTDTVSGHATLEVSCSDNCSLTGSAAGSTGKTSVSAKIGSSAAAAHTTASIPLKFKSVGKKKLTAKTWRKIARSISVHLAVTVDGKTVPVGYTTSRSASAAGFEY